MTWTVLLHPDAQAELGRLPVREQVALRNAMRKLEEIGPGLTYPHSSAIEDADRLREPRPRAGNSPWRAYYRQVGEVFVMGAVGPEAQVKPRDLTKAVRTAEERINQLEEAN